MQFLKYSAVTDFFFLVFLPSIYKVAKCTNPRFCQGYSFITVTLSYLYDSSSSSITSESHCASIILKLVVLLLNNYHYEFY